MAAFSFPQNPSNGDTVTNSATGLTYVFASLPSPGKWEVQMRDNEADFVNVSGDTMTGALDIIPSSVIPASTSDATLMAKASPFSSDSSTLNYISRVLQAKTNQNHTIFEVRDSDTTNLSNLEGRITAINCYSADTLIEPTLNSIAADNFPNSGLRAGFRVGGRQTGGALGDVLNCTYFDDEGTQMNYYGDILTSNSIVTKQYVDTAVQNSVPVGTYVPTTGGTMTGELKLNGTGEVLDVNTGNFVVDNLGNVDMTGNFTLVGSELNATESNITVKQGPANAAGDKPSNGAIYTKTSDGTIGFSAFPNGNVIMGDTLAFSHSSANKIIDAYGNSSPSFVFKLGSSAGATTEKLKIGSNGTVIQGGLDVEGVAGQYAALFDGDIFLPQPSTKVSVYGSSSANLQIYVGADSSTTSRQVAIYDDNLFLFSPVTCYSTVSSTGITVSGAGSIGSGLTVTGGLNVTSGTTTFSTPVNCNNNIKFNSSNNQNIDTKGNILIYGLKPSDNTRPSWEAVQIGSDPNNENFSALTIGKRVYYSGTYVYLDSSVRTYVNTSTWDFRDNDTSNNILWSVSSGGVTYSTAVTVPEPTALTHAATKNYVNTQEAALKSSLYAAVNSSTDYASLKAALLSALQQNSSPSCSDDHIPN